MDNSHTLFDSWSLKGHWWIATLAPVDEGKVRAVAGELSYDGLDEGVKLLLLGQLEPEVAEEELKKHTPEDDDNVSQDEPEELEPEPEQTPHEDEETLDLCLHGRTVCGKPITLLTLTELGGSQNLNSPLSVQRNFTVRLALLNIHANHQTTFSKITLSFPGLDAFIRIHATLDAFRDELSHTLVVPRKPSEWSIESVYKDIPIRLEFWQRSSLIGNFASHLEIGSISALTIESDTPQVLDWWIEVAYSMQYFMSLMYGFPICPDRLFIDSISGTGTQCSVWYSFARSGIKREIKKDELIVANGCCDWVTISSALDGWLRMPEEFVSVAHQFFGNFYAPHNKARVDFVFYSQTLEIFHELLHPTDSLLSEFQHQLFRGLKTFMKKNIKKKDLLLYKELTNRLAYTGYPSQRTRLQDLFRILESYIPSIFYEDPWAFVTCVVDTRNFYIHGSLPDKDTFLSLFEQTAAVEGLKLAALLLFLRYLGFPGEDVQRRIYANQTMKNWLSLSSRYLDDEALKTKLKTKRGVNGLTDS